MARDVIVTRRESSAFENFNATPPPFLALLSRSPRVLNRARKILFSAAVRSVKRKQAESLKSDDGAGITGPALCSSKRLSRFQRHEKYFKIKRGKKNPSSLLSPFPWGKVRGRSTRESGSGSFPLVLSGL